MLVAEVEQAVGERFSSGERLNFAPATGKRFRCNFIEPGVVDYSDCKLGTELLRAATIDAALESFIGKPLTMGHVPTNKPIPSNLIHGRIDKVGYDPESKMYFCEGPIETDEGRAALKARKPSCGYRVLSTGEGGMSHNIPYERELTGIEFHHLAIVDNPRYEDATFRLNSKKAAMPSFKIRWKFWSKDNEGKEVAEERTNDVAPDSVVEIEGVPVADLIAGYRANEAAKVAAAEAAKKEEEARENAKCEAEAKAKADAEAKEKADAEARENEAKRKTKEEGEAKFRELAAARENAAARPISNLTSPGTLADQIARGASRYGSGNN